MKQLSHSVEAGMAATGLSRAEFCRRWESIRRQIHAQGMGLLRSQATANMVAIHTPRAKRG